MVRSNSNSKLSTKDVCRTYYETQVFGPGGIGDASQPGFFTAARICLEVRDASFKGVDVDTYTNEIIAANIELFGLAWLDHQREYAPHSSNNLIPEEINFTKGYMTDVGREDIWKRMGAYNGALMTTIAGLNNSESHERLRDIPTSTYDEEYKKATDADLMKSVEFLGTTFGMHVADNECLKRLIVRMLAIPCDTQRITAFSQSISLILAERLGIDPKANGLFAVQRIVVGLYGNALNYLDSVRDYGSYDAAKNARADLLQGLIKWVKRRL